jgi:hypothetical protein
MPSVPARAAIVRPDGYLAWASAAPDPDDLAAEALARFGVTW